MADVLVLKTGFEGVDAKEVLEYSATMNVGDLLRYLRIYDESTQIVVKTGTGLYPMAELEEVYEEKVEEDK